MPMYEFKCLDCEEVFEVIVRNADAAKDVTCKSCKSENIRKNISAGSFHSKTSTSPLAGAGCAARGGFS